jgi:hypothetical protein
MRVVKNALIRVRNLVVHEFPLLGAVAIAAVNTATDHSPKGYVVAVGVALLRFVSSPAFEAKAVEEKAISPKLIAAVQAVLASQAAAQAIPAVSVDVPVVEAS